MLLSLLSLNTKLKVLFIINLQSTQHFTEGILTCISGSLMNMQRLAQWSLTRAMPEVMVVLCCLLASGWAHVQLSHISTVQLGLLNAEQTAYDPVTKTFFVVGESTLFCVPANTQGVLKKDSSVTDPDGKTFTDVAVCGDRVFVTADSGDGQGQLHIYNRNLSLVERFDVGGMPDMLKVRHGCETVLVAIEAEAREGDKSVEDPEGAVAIVHLASKVVNRLDFTHFNDRYEDLAPAGVRFVYRKGGNSFSRDIEPEYIAVDEEKQTAYVGLQENNAIAVIDLNTENITAIHGLGYKQWGYLDTSDKDGGIQISYWPIRAWYQPDAIKLHHWKGRTLLFTADEGAEKKYKAVDFDESTRGKKLAKHLGDDIHPIVKDAISKDSKLGRLKFSRYEGRNSSGHYNSLYTYGGRGFSIWNLDNMDSNPRTPLERLFNSGSDMEEMTALHCPHLFNTNPDGDKIDKSSDNKGPATESLTLGEIGGRLYVFVGNERPGTIAIYSIRSDATQARFETIFCDGIPDNGKSISDMLGTPEVYAVDPEDIWFIQASESPTGRDMLAVAGSVSGTLTTLEVKVTPRDNDAVDENSTSSLLSSHPSYIVG